MTKDGNNTTLDLEQQIAFLQEQLAQAQKLTALGELASTTTHEFNNVLMTIINYAKMGLRHTDDATRGKAFEKILAAGNRAATAASSPIVNRDGSSPSPRPRHPTTSASPSPTAPA